MFLRIKGYHREEEGEVKDTRGSPSEYAGVKDHKKKDKNSLTKSFSPTVFTRTEGRQERGGGKEKNSKRKSFGGCVGS